MDTNVLQPGWLKIVTCMYFLSIGLSSGTCFAADEETDSRVRIIEPDDRVTTAKPAAIDDERFELGAYMGSLSVEDFGTNVVTGIEFSYHLTSKWMLQFNYGQSSVDKAAFESSQQQFLSDSDRDFIYYGFIGGYKIFDGRSFLGARNKYNTGLYALAGAESVSFADNDETGFVFGLSYRLVLTDWLTANIDFREHMVKRSFIGDDKQTMNTEFRIGVNGLF